MFGVSSDECLNYAMLNRAEWEVRGQEILKDMIESLHAEGNDEELRECAPFATVEEVADDVEC